MIPILQQMFLSEYSFGKPGSSSFSSTIPIKRNWSGGKCTDLTFQLIGDGGGRRRCAPAAAPGLAAAEGRGGGGRRSEEKVVGLRVGVLVVESEGRGGGGHGGEGRGREVAVACGRWWPKRIKGLLAIWIETWQRICLAWPSPDSCLRARTTLQRG